MVQDTISMDAIFIHAMPLKSLFNNEFVHSAIPDDAYERARKNLENEAMKDEYRLRPADANASQLYLAQSRVNRMYYYGQTPPQNYFSPSAWIQFFDAWKRGDYKRSPNAKASTLLRIEVIQSMLLSVFHSKDVHNRWKQCVHGLHSALGGPRHRNYQSFIHHSSHTAR